MTISTTGIILGALFLIIPIYVICTFHIRLARPLAMATAKMLLKFGILFAIFYAISISGSWLASIVFTILFILYSAAVATVKARLRLRSYYMPVAVGMLSATAVVSLCLVFVNLHANGSTALKCFVPLAAMLCGNIVPMQAKALSAYYMGLKHHNKLYYYLLGNGANRKEALHYLLKRALEQALIPGISQMSTTLASASPAVVWAMMLCGESIGTAVAMQLLLLLAALSASMIAVLTTVTIARHYALDDYGRMKE